LSSQSTAADPSPESDSGGRGATLGGLALSASWRGAGGVGATDDSGRFSPLAAGLGAAASGRFSGAAASARFSGAAGGGFGGVVADGFGAAGSTRLSGGGPAAAGMAGSGRFSGSCACALGAAGSTRWTD
jgi:hypothetical protein